MSFRRKRVPAQGGLLLGFVIALPDRPPLPACARPQISQPEGASQSAQGPIEGALAPEVIPTTRLFSSQASFEPAATRMCFMTARPHPLAGISALASCPISISNFRSKAMTGRCRDGKT